MIYDRLVDGDGADNDLNCAAARQRMSRAKGFAFDRRERSGQLGAAFVWGYALLGACSCALRHGEDQVPLLLRHA